ncbi:Aminopeptidase M1 [Citrus sinensis]|nr:Aminopeptidase M1 [Citrus sinensis]
MEQKLNRNQFKGQARLPKFAIPILFTSSHNQEYRPSDAIMDKDDEILVLVFDEPLTVGEGILGIIFSGKLNEHTKGFYKCSYVEKEVKKNMAVTQFEAVDARRCFPCWDEPALKATFKITLDIPSELTALSNMPILDEKLNGNLKTVYFEESPVMSTYLVAFVVGLFDHIEDTTTNGVKVRVYCPVGKSSEGKHALNVAIKSLGIYTEFFSTPYPLPKLDLVAVSEFHAGAMENFGLIVYRENELLYNEKTSTANRKQIMAISTSHEVAHQWFGNLVTMEWWTHLWLNEGFATWISYMATDIMFPEWKMWTQFLRQTSHGLRLDAQEQSHPIEVEVHRADEIDQVFDAISYNKGSAVIRMLQSYLGEDIFQVKSLSLYMKKYAWKNVKTEDLWSVLSEESGINITSLMECWTKQKGHPVVYVNCKDNLLEFKQSQFVSSGLQGDGRWTIPITLSLGSYNNQRNFLLESQSQSVNISEMLPSSDGKLCSFKECDETLWIKVNVEQSGFYRVIYDDELSARLRKAVENNCLSAADKLGILDDMLALCQACKQPLSYLLLLLDAHRKEHDSMVLSKLINVCYDVVEIITDAMPDAVNELKVFFISLLQSSAERLGWEPKPGESHLNVLLRGEVFTALASFGHDKTHKEAMQRFRELLNDKDTILLSADLKKEWLESLLKFYREADAVQEKERILQTIASSPDPALVNEVLTFLISDEVRNQDINYGLSGLRFECREAAWRWLQENWDKILMKYEGFLLHSFARDFVTLFSSNEKADEIEAFFASHVQTGVDKVLKQSIEKIRIKARWMESIKQEQSLPDLIKQLAHKGY